MSKLIEKLQDIAQYSDGIFVTGQPVNGQSELSYFNVFYKRYPYYFHTIDVSRTKMLQLTQRFNNDYFTPKRVLKISNPSEIIQRILWTGLILKEIKPSSFPIKTFKWGKHSFILDNMSESKEYFTNLKKNISFQGVVTITPRIKFFNYLDIWSITPFLCNKIWIKKHLNLFYHRNCNEVTPLNEFNKNQNNFPDIKRQDVFDRFLKEGIWPEHKEQCHKEKKMYPGIGNPITGFQKWIMDKSILNSGSEVPEKYFFGLYP